MFFSDPAFDLKLSLNLLGLSLIIALIILAATRKKFLSLVVFSILGNLSFLLNIGSMMFDFYGIKWMGYFALIFWPIINIYLAVKYINSRKTKQ